MGAHRIRSRHSGERVFIELFLEFDPEISVREMTRCAGQIRSEIEAVIPGAEVLVIPCGGETFSGQGALGFDLRDAIR